MQKKPGLSETKIVSKLDFECSLEGQVVVIDNNSKLLQCERIDALLNSKAFAIVAFDPLRTNWCSESYHKCSDVQLIPYAVLGDDTLATLYTTMNPAMTSTLPPLAAEKLPERLRQGAQILTETPINTVALDRIDNLISLDWLLLDGCSNIASILEHGKEMLSNTLLIEVRIAFELTHENQASLDEINKWVSSNGFRFYRLINDHLHDELKENSDLGQRQVTELATTSVIYIPDYGRMAVLNNDQRIKIAFILNTIYGLNDLANSLLKSMSQDADIGYLENKKTVKVETASKSREVSSFDHLTKFLETATLMQIKPNHFLPDRLIVSLTSYEPRFATLHLTLRSLLLQNIRPDILVLWIAKHERGKLPQEVLELECFGLNICYCEDIRSYKKIIPTLREYPNSFIATADDDVYYEPDWLQGLIDCWDGSYKTVVAHRAHKIVLNEKFLPVPYQNWKMNVIASELDDGLIFPTGCAGVLYPPDVFCKDVIDSNIFMKLCPSGDDIWLYWMASRNGAKAKRSNYNFNLVVWSGTRHTALWPSNIHGGANDKAIEKMISLYGMEWSKENVFQVLISFFYREKTVYFYLPNKYDHIQKIIKSTKSFYEIRMLEDIKSRIKNIDTIFDVGANIGNHSVFFGMFTDAKRIFSFEPHPDSFLILKKNIKANMLDSKVTLYEVGLSDEPGTAEISFYDESNTGMVQLKKSNSGSIRLLQADQVAHDENVEVGLMKIDVEGMELSVLKGAEKILSKYKPILYIEAGAISQLDDISAYLAEFGYVKMLRFNATPTYLFLYVNGSGSYL